MRSDIRGRVFPFSRTLVICLLMAGAAPAEDLSVRVLRQGVFEGYPAGKRNQSGDLVYFESSAVATDGKWVWFTGDKPSPSTTLSSVVQIPLARLTEKCVVPWSDAIPVMAPAFRLTQKIEATALAENGLRFACTAFDRFVPETKVADPYNIVIAWRGNDMRETVILNATTRDEGTSSIVLREPIRAALKDSEWPEGPPYFKIEGLAALPGNRLWFGVRESGKDGRKPEYFRCRFTVLETEWEEKDGRIAIRPEFRKVFDASPEQLGAAGITGVGLGLSSLEYDAGRGIVWAVASWEEATTETTKEKDTGNGSWLLALTTGDGLELPKIVPVSGIDSDGRPLSFTSKVEGLCLVGEHTLLLVSDEDRRATVVETADGPKVREPHMGVWTLVDILTPQ